MAEVKRIAAGLDDSIQGLRDRTLLLVWFMTALRRSEVAEMEVSSLVWENAGLRIKIPESKTDRFRVGQAGFVSRAEVELRPVESLDTWLEAAQISDGPIWRWVHASGKVMPYGLSGRGLAQTIKRLVATIGLDARTSMAIRCGSAL